MKRTASEVIRELELRVARLEKSAILGVDEKVWFRLGGFKECGTHRGHFSSVYDTTDMDIDVICKKVQSEFKEKLTPSLSNREVDSIISSLFRPLLRIAKVFKKYGEGEIKNIYVRKTGGEKITLSFYLEEGLRKLHYRKAKLEVLEKSYNNTILRKRSRKLYPFKYSLPLPEQKGLYIEYNPLKGLWTASDPKILKLETIKVFENGFNKIIEEEKKWLDFDPTTEVEKWVETKLEDKIQSAEREATSMLAFYEEVVEDYEGEFPLPHKDYGKDFDSSSYLDPEDAQEAWLGIMSRGKLDRFDALLEYVEHKVDYSDIYNPRILVLFKVDPSFKDYGQSVPSSEWEINDMTPPSEVESCLVSINLTKSGRLGMTECDTMSNNKRLMRG